LLPHRGCVHRATAAATAAPGLRHFYCPVRVYLYLRLVGWLPLGSRICLRVVAPHAVLAFDYTTLYTLTFAHLRYTGAAAPVYPDDLLRGCTARAPALVCASRVTYAALPHTRATPRRARYTSTTRCYTAYPVYLVIVPCLAWLVVLHTHSTTPAFYHTTTHLHNRTYTPAGYVLRVAFSCNVL